MRIPLLPLLPLVSVLIAVTEALAQKDARLPIPIQGSNYVAPDINEIRVYFITGLIGFIIFVGKEVWAQYKKSKDTTAQDIHQILMNQERVANQIDGIKEQLKYKPNRDEVIKDIIDTVRREMDHVSKIQRQ